MRPLYLVIFILVSSLFFQCAKEKAAPLVVPVYNVCDSINPVSYADDVVPILTDNNCFFCHDSQGNAFPPLLTDYASVFLERDRILKAIQHDPSLRAMPYDVSTFQPVAKLEDSIINKVQCWIESGAPNN